MSKQDRSVLINFGALLIASILLASMLHDWRAGVVAFIVVWVYVYGDEP